LGLKNVPGLKAKIEKAVSKAKKDALVQMGDITSDLISRSD